MDRESALARLSEARVARLATVDAGGLPHVVPLVFGAAGSTLYWAVDEKPKRTRDLKRLRNIQVNPNVQLLVDHFDEDWSRLWWVRASGPCRVVTDRVEADRGLELLLSKYEQHRAHPPRGPFMAIDIVQVGWWESREDLHSV